MIPSDLDLPLRATRRPSQVCAVGRGLFWCPLKGPRRGKRLSSAKAGGIPDATILKWQEALSGLHQAHTEVQSPCAAEDTGPSLTWVAVPGLKPGAAGWRAGCRVRSQGVVLGCGWWA